MARDVVSTILGLRIDGDVSTNNLLPQLQTDLLGIPVVHPEIIETTVLDVTYLTGIAAGFYHDEVEVVQRWRASRTLHPVISRDEATRRIAQWEMTIAQIRLPTTRDH